MFAVWQAMKKIRCATIAKIIATSHVHAFIFDELGISVYIVNENYGLLLLVFVLVTVNIFMDLRPVVPNISSI